MVRVASLVLLLAGAWLLPASVEATPLVFNSTSPSGNADERDDWLDAIGIVSPEYLVDFESGFTDGQNVSGVGGLFPGGLVITDTGGGNEAFVSSGTFGSSNPVGTLALEQDEDPWLELDFSASPVDYVGLQDIDQAGSDVRVTFVGGDTFLFDIETTGGSGNSAEFLGIFRNDMPRITLVQFDASGDGSWAIDNIEYGVVPEPGTLLLVGTGAAVLIGRHRRRRNRSLHPSGTGGA